MPEENRPALSWHPPQSLLEIAELVLTGALPVAPGIVEVPSDLGERLDTGAAVTLEDAEGTPVATLTRRVLGGEPGSGEPVGTEPVGTGPVGTGPVGTGPVGTGPVGTGPVGTGPAGVEPSGPGLPGTGSVDAGLSGSGLSGAGLSSAGLSGAEPVSLPEFTPLKPFTHGPARAARQTPAQVRATFPEGAAVLAVPVTGLLTAAAVEEVRGRARQTEHHLLWIAVAGAGRKLALPADGLWRAVRDVATGPSTPSETAVLVAVPWLTHTDDAALLTAVARGYGATEVLNPETSNGRDGELHPAFAREYARAVPPPHRRGLTLFFTGLSGSGKSTVAKALAERLLDHTTRTVSLLDGDEVRRMLSAGLTFSRADRDLNIRRIGYVAAEITRHGGLAVCAPIAPFEAVRAQVRAEVEQAGDFVLVHIATPLEECERRDRKGLYAKARRGEIPDFTGISSPYEIPVDPELRLDTTGISIDDAVDQVWSLLTERGYLTAPQNRS